ncbi:MAG TPA: hypothetical protein VF494_04665 [Candidatus Limnocylindrales bacterium]
MTAAAVNVRRARTGVVALHERHRARADRLAFAVLRILIVGAVVVLAVVGIADITAAFAAAAQPTGIPTPGFGL